MIDKLIIYQMETRAAARSTLSVTIVEQTIKIPPPATDR